MIRSKWNVFLIGAMVVLVSFNSGGDMVEWNLNFDEAKAKATESNKIIVMSFQGSDWCGNCKRLEKSLFETPEFVEFSKKHLVMQKVDFPMRKENRLSKEQTKYNEELAELFNPDGVFPKVIVFNSSGEKLGEMSYPQNSIEDYLSTLKLFIE